ncbi:hypothetical protein V6N11_031157 [Hibiscus sabdariffa]|uniref:Uncharacterized protein n=1 Tax=Hibiscus sabdariffa TaxID=183260 RepID=A0ABR1ZKZ7_9ROSI
MHRAPGRNQDKKKALTAAEPPLAVDVPRLVTLDKRVTNYEKIHERRQPVRSENSKIISKGDGTTEIKFNHSHLQDQPTPVIFPTQLMMQSQGDPTGAHDPEDPSCYCDLCHPGAESRMVEKFTVDGKPIYSFRNQLTGHCPWDEDCTCEMCVEFNFYEELTEGYHESYKPHKKKSKKRSVHSDLYKRWKSRDSTVGPLDEDDGRFVFLVDYGPKPPNTAQIPLSTSSTTFNQPPPPPKSHKPKPKHPVLPCYKKIQKWIKKNPQSKMDPLPDETSSSEVFMFHPTNSSYDTDFPPLEEFMEKEYKHVPKIPSPLVGGKTSAAESTLNWQTENAIAQNKVLHRIDTKVTQMKIKIDQIETKVDSNMKIANELMVLLHKRLQQIEKQPTPPGVELFYHLEMKQKEIQTLKEQISIRRGPPPQAQPSIFPVYQQGVASSQSSMFGTTITEQKKPTTYEIYQLIKRQEAEKKREKDKRGKDIQDDDPSPKISKVLMVQKTNPLSSLLKDYGESRIPKIATIEDQEIESSTSSENESLNDSYDSSEDQIMMTNQPEVKEEYPEDEPMEASAPPTNQPPIPNTGAKYNFTIDDIPVLRWSQRFQEFHSWMDTQKLSRESHYDILTEFVSRFTGVLRD